MLFKYTLLIFTSLFIFNRSIKSKNLSNFYYLCRTGPVDFNLWNSKKGEVVNADSAGTSLFFYKTSTEHHIGAVSYFKVMCGTVHEGEDFLNADRGSKERIAQLYVSAGSNRTQISELAAGDLGCTVKLKDVRTGNTLNAGGADNSFFCGGAGCGTHCTAKSTGTAAAA